MTPDGHDFLLEDPRLLGPAPEPPRVLLVLLIKCAAHSVPERRMLVLFIFAASEPLIVSEVVEVTLRHDPKRTDGSEHATLKCR